MGKVKTKLHKVDVEIIKILAVVSRLTEISITKMRGRSRKGEINVARRICIVLINDTLNYTYAAIGGIFNRDHSTALHACKVHCDIYDTDVAYREFFNLCAAAIGLDILASSNNKTEIISRLMAKIEGLEVENKELKSQLTKVRNIMIDH